MGIDEKADAWLEDERTAALYQVIGSLAEAAGVFDDPQVIRALDLAAYGKPQDGGDVLPFAPAYESAKQKEAEGWLSMDSAPKDGEIFLGIGPEEAWPVAMLWQAYDADDAAEIGSDGYWTYAEQLIADVTGEAKPTAWRPLPVPPEAA
jgi:hypothetical protein